MSDMLIKLSRNSTVDSLTVIPGVETITDIEELKRLIKRKITILKKRLDFYETLLKVLEECGNAVTASIVEEIRDEEGNIVARVYKLGNTMKMVLSKPVNASNPYIRFLARRFARMQDEGVDIELELEKSSDGRIQAVIVKGALDTDEMIESILRVLKFAALKIAKGSGS